MVDWVRPIFCSFVLFPCHPSPTVHFGLGSVLWKGRGRGAVATNQQIYRLNCLSSEIDRERRTNIIIHLVFFLLLSSTMHAKQFLTGPNQWTNRRRRSFVKRLLTDAGLEIEYVADYLFALYPNCIISMRPATWFFFFFTLYCYICFAARHQTNAHSRIGRTSYSIA